MKSNVIDHLYSEPVLNHSFEMPYGHDHEQLPPVSNLHVSEWKESFIFCLK